MTLISRLLSCGVAMVAIAALCGCGGAATRFASHLQRGEAFLASGNLDKAGVEFRNAAQIQPRNPRALYFNGRVAEARSNIREAYGYYQAAVDADASYDAARAAAGKMLIFAGGAKRALDLVAPGLLAHPDDADLLVVRAAAHQQLKEKDAARADAERAIKLAPSNENALAILAALYADGKELPRAIALVSTAIAQKPASIPLHEVLTNLYLMSGEPAAAEAEMRKVIELQPMELGPRSQLAAYLARSHDLDGAQGVLEDAVKVLSKGKQPAKADAAKLLLVDFLARGRSRAEGEKTLRAFIAREPADSDLRLGLGSLLQRTGATAEAIKAYEGVIEREGTRPKALMARNRLAAMQLADGRVEQARKLIAEVLESNPRDDDALILRSTVELQQHDAPGAISDLRAVLRNQPKSVALQRSLASAYLSNKQPALAEETLRAVQQFAPNDAAVRIELAQLLSQTGRLSQAVTLLEATVKLLPDDAQAREGLIRAYLAAGNQQGARAAAQELKAHLPQSALGFYYAGIIAAQDKRLEESQNDLHKAHELEPDRMEVVASLVKVEVDRGSYDAAIATLQGALGRDPKNARLLNLLGEVYIVRQDLGHARDAFQRAVALDPRQSQPLRNLARVKLAAQDVDGAAGEFQAALKLAPADPQLVAEATAFYEKHNRVDEAVAAYEALYRENPQAKKFAANNLAMLLVTYRNDSTSLDRARELSSDFATSDNGGLLDTLGWVQFKRGEYQKALAILERAVEHAPESRVIRFHLGMDQLQLGLREQARTNLETAVNGGGTFQGVEEARVALANLKVRA
jgi:tetratricopeptide (TPR) repeat protein